MCTVSMIYDHFHEKWKWIEVPKPDLTPLVYPPPPPVPPISREEIEEFRKLLERAREYDRKHNQPDCELEEKRQKLKELAETLGVEIAFL